MLCCDKCNVSVSGTHRRCPLCQGTLSGTGSAETSVYPTLRRDEHRHLVIRSLVFLSFAAMVLCVCIDVLLTDTTIGSSYVIAAVACTWVCLANIMLRRHNIAKSILWTAFLVSLLAIGWDYFTGWHHWALDYVIPSVLVFTMLSVAVISKIMRKHIGEYAIYLIIDGLFGIVPSLFLLFNWVTVRYPSVICIATSLISLAALCTFESEQIKTELKKRLHL